MGDAARHQVVRDISPRLPELTHTVVTAVQAAVPAYRDLQGAQLRDVEAIASWVLVRVLQTWADGTGLGDLDRARFRAIGAARAEDGRPITAVLRAYRVAALTASDAVREIGIGRLDIEDVADMISVLLIALDEISEALMTGHSAARERMSGDRDRALRELLDDLLAGRHSSAGALADRSRELGAQLSARPVLVVAGPGDLALSASHATAAELLADLALDRADDHLTTLRGGRAVFLLPDLPRPQIEQACASRSWQGCFIHGHPIASVAALYRLAAEALDTAPAHAFHGRALLDEGDARLIGLLAARPGTDPALVMSSVLGPLADRANRHLLDGVAAFMDSGSATGAAQRLHVHPQTLRYRLRRARELTGRDPQDPWQRLTLDVARQLHQIQVNQA